MKAAIGVLVSAFSISAFASPAVTGEFGSQDGGQDQHREELSVAVVDAHGPVSGATCTLTNDKGNWTVKAPDTVRVARSKSDLQVECVKDGYDKTSGTLNASTTEITPKHFSFSSDAGGDGADGTVTVPVYAPQVTVTIDAKPAA